jgi:hypothetical protein
MSIKLNTARRYLEGSGLQVSVEAAAALAFLLDEKGAEISRLARVRVEDENRARKVQGLPPRIRLTAADVRKASEDRGA